MCATITSQIILWYNLKSNRMDWMAPLGNPVCTWSGLVPISAIPPALYGAPNRETSHLLFIYLFIFLKKRKEEERLVLFSRWASEVFFFDRILWKKEKRKKKWDHLGYEAKGSFRLTLDLPIFLFLKITNYL